MHDTVFRMLMFSSWSRHRSVVRLAAAGLLVTLLGSTGVLAAGDGAAAVGSSEQRSTDVVDVTADPARVGPGAVSDWIRLVPSSLVLGELRVTAPPGTTIVWAEADVRPLEGSIASDGSSATWVGRNSWSEGWRVPKVRLRVSPETPPGRTSGSIRVVDPEGGAVVATGTLPVDVTAPDVAIPVERTPLGVGTESGWIAVVPERTVAGVLTVTAPPGTSITAADADVRPLAGRIAEDGSSATWPGNNTWSSGWRAAKIRLRADDDAPSEAVTGTARITENGGSRVLAEGTVPVDLTGSIGVVVPPLASGTESERVPVHVGADVQGDLRVEVPVGSEVTGAGFDGSDTGADVAPDSRSVVWRGEGVSWSDPSRHPWFTVRTVARQDGERREGDVRVLGDSGAVLAHGRFTVVDTGPRPASMEPSEDLESTAVRVHGLGSAAAEQAREERRMRHSDLQPTGRFVRAGERVTVDVPADAPSTGIRVGLYGAYEGVAATSLSALVPTPSGTSTSWTADRDGMLFLVSTAPTGSAVLRVHGGRVVPTFVLGQTSDAEFREQLRTLPDAPVVELVGGRVFGDFQRRSASAFPADMTARLQTWDDVVSLTNRTYNLHDDLVGTARKAPHRIYIASPDTGVGYASATQEHVTFQVDTDAAADLFRLPVSDLWGFWHEVGHTYQMPASTWDGQGEVSVNISALAVQHALGAGNRLDTKRDLVEAFFAQPVGERTYAGEDLFVRLLMYDQLRRAFGDHFYPRLNQELRVANALGELDLGTSQATVDSFATVAGRLADRDLRPFFEQWGIPIGEQAAADLAQRPALQRAIWENVDTSTDRPEHVLPEVGTPVGAIVGAPEVVVGQRHFPDVPVEGIGSSDGAPVSVGATTVSAVDQGYGSITVELVDPRGPREVIDGTIRARAGNLVDLLGQKDRPVARLAILPEDHELRLVPRTTYQAHSSWAGREYIGIELRSADDERSLGDWSIKGDETAYPLADRFDAHWQEGQILVIRHQQHDGVFPWRDSERMPASTDLVQRFRIVDGGLVRDDGVFTAVSIASPEDGADTDLRPVLTGHGEPGSAVVVRRKDTDDVLGEGHVDHRGEWTIELDSDLEERRQTLVVTQYGPGDDPGTV
jgi:hypothetical protein